MNTTDTPTTDQPVSGQGTPAFARVPASHYDLFVGVFVALLVDQKSLGSYSRGGDHHGMGVMGCIVVTDL